MANEDQARYWNEEGGPRWVANERSFDVMLEPFGVALQDAADPRVGEHVLDIGCGFGTTTLAMATAVGPTGRVMALDLSDVMLARVRSRAAAAGLGNVITHVGDAQTDALPAHHFHLAVSRFGVMFFDDPVAAFANVGRSLRPGGRLSFVCWQPVTAIEWMAVPLTAIARVTGAGLPAPSRRPGPNAFGDGDYVRTIVQTAGFADVKVTSFTAPVVMGGGDGLDAAVEHCESTGEVKRTLAALDDDQRAAASGLVRDALAAHLVDGRVVLGGAAWVVTART
jgi:SAM-dependent methyltransferase